jgi:hypothetical protein
LPPFLVSLANFKVLPIKPEMMHLKKDTTSKAYLISIFSDDKSKIKFIDAYVASSKVNKKDTGDILKARIKVLSVNGNLYSVYKEDTLLQNPENKEVISIIRIKNKYEVDLKSFLIYIIDSNGTKSSKLEVKR